MTDNYILLIILHLVVCLLLLSDILQTLPYLLFGLHMFLSTCYQFAHTLVVFGTYSITKLGQTSRKSLDFQSALLVKDNFSIVKNHWSDINEYTRELIITLFSTIFIISLFEQSPNDLCNPKAMITTYSHYENSYLRYRYHSHHCNDHHSHETLFKQC